MKNDRLDGGAGIRTISALFYGGKELGDRREMRTGRVKWFDERKGYGFLYSEGRDYFIHYKDIEGKGFKSLEKGEVVEFEISSKGKERRTRAINVQRESKDELEGRLMNLRKLD